MTDAAPSAPFHLRRILCPVDFSAPAEDALRYALQLAGPLGAEVHVAHVFHMPVPMMPDGELYSLPDLIESTRADLRRTLDDLARRLPGITRTHLVDGQPDHEIDALA